MGSEVAIGSPGDAIRAGIALCPEDRKRDALVLQRSVAENIALTSQDRLARFRYIDRRREAELVDGYVQELRIKTPDRDGSWSSLSGGNQQKVVLARALAMRPRILILDEPTRGIDIGAKSEIYALIEQTRRRGHGDHPHLVRADRGARPGRPDHRHARREDDRRARWIDGHRGGDPDPGHGA